jgi:hypothetical protein
MHDPCMSLYSVLITLSLKRPAETGSPISSVMIGVDVPHGDLDGPSDGLEDVLSRSLRTTFGSARNDAYCAGRVIRLPGRCGIKDDLHEIHRRTIFHASRRCQVASIKREDGWKTRYQLNWQPVRIWKEVVELRSSHIPGPPLSVGVYKIPLPSCRHNKEKVRYSLI